MLRAMRQMNMNLRSLAQRSAAEAKEIKRLIADTVRWLAEGEEQVADAGETMRSIVASVRQVEAIMAEMTRASAEQSSGAPRAAKVGDISEAST